MNGDKLWESSLNTGIIAAPITYMVDDVQYISIPVGWGGVLGLWYHFTDQINPGSIFTFAVGKKEPMPEYPVKPERKLISLEVSGSDEEIKHGETLFTKYCSNCHNLDFGGVIPNLTYSTPETFQIFKTIVKDGAFLSKGMPRFDDRLSEQGIADIKQYILSISKNKRTEN